MTTRNGKVARLPFEIRDQLNIRLADGEPGNHLVEWLNANPAVMKVMAEHFDGRPITEQNLSEWRAGGYEEWLTLRAFLDESRVLSENAGEVADTGINSEHLYMVLLAHHAHLLQNWEIMPETDFKRKLEALRKLTASIMSMRRNELQKACVQLQRERLELLREKQSLQSAPSSEAIGRGAHRQAQGLEQAKRVETDGGGPGKSRASRASTSRNAPPNATDATIATEIQQSATHVSPFGPGHPSSSDARSAESAIPPLSFAANKSAPGVQPLSGRIQPDCPHLVTHSQSSINRFDSLGFRPFPVCHHGASDFSQSLESGFRFPVSKNSLFPESDRLGLLLAQPSKLAA